MKQPIHAISQSPAMTPERVVGIGFVGVLHVIAIWAIIAGLGQQILKIVDPPPIIATIDDPQKPPPSPPAQPPKVFLPNASTTEAVKPPIFTIQDDPAPRVPIQTGPTQPPQQQQQVAIADSAASGVVGTHTIPPYPMTAIRLSEEGRVMLHLTISAEGSVTGASVTQSSGFTDLDQSAIAWVLAHWKYKAAIRGGVAVASATDAAVVFSLKNAR